MAQRVLLVVGLALLWPLLTVVKTSLDVFTNHSGIVGMGPLAFVFSGSVVLIALGVWALFRYQNKKGSADPGQAAQGQPDYGRMQDKGIAPREAAGATPARLRAAQIADGPTSWPAVLTGALGAASSLLLLAGEVRGGASLAGDVLAFLCALTCAATLCALTIAWARTALLMHVQAESERLQARDEACEDPQAAADEPRRARSIAVSTRNPAGTLVVYVCISLVLSFALRLVIALALGWRGTQVLGAGMRVAYPILAVAVWLLTEALMHRQVKAAAAVSPAEGAACGTDSARSAIPAGADERAAESPAADICASEGSHKLQRTIVVAAGVFVLLTSITVGVRAGGVSDYPIDITGQRYWLALVFSPLLLAVAILVRNRPRLSALPWGATLLLVLAGALLALIPDDSLNLVGVNAMLVGRLTLWALFWTLPVQLTWSLRAHVTPCMAVLYLLPQGLSYICTDGLYLLTSTETVPLAVLDVCTVVLVLTLVTCALVIANLSSAAGASLAEEEGAEGGAATQPTVPDEAAPNLSDLRDEACQQLAAAYGLTDRETIVLSLVSQGYTVPQIAELRHVSQNTVRTHTKGLYRKMDCHAKQDIIAAVTAEMESLM